MELGQQHALRSVTTWTLRGRALQCYKKRSSRIKQQIKIPLEEVTSCSLVKIYRSPAFVIRLIPQAPFASTLASPYTVSAST